MTEEDYDTAIEDIRQRKGAYQALGSVALEDLQRFCRGNDTCFHADARIHAALEGRREVYLRIMRYRTLSPEQIFELIPLKNKGDSSDG